MPTFLCILRVRRRDKYMFHQLNVIPAADVEGKSLLEYWYERVMATFSSFVTFPVKVIWLLLFCCC